MIESIDVGGIRRTLLKVRDGKRFMVTTLGFAQPSKISRFAHVDSLGRHSNFSRSHTLLLVS